MNKWIRWPGLMAFAITLGGILSFWFLFADTLLEWTIEETGAYVVGAKVDLDSADLSLRPLGVVLSGLRVANPDEPMTNAFEADRISFLMDGGKLLLRDVIIEEMSVTGMRFGARRKSSGALLIGGKKPSEPKAGKEIKTEGGKADVKEKFLEIPDAKEILAKEELKTVKEYEALKTGMESDKKSWSGRIAGLADSKKIDGYESRLNALKSGGVKSLDDAKKAVAELSSIKDSITKDLDGLNKAKSDLDKTLLNYSDRIKRFPNIPAEDLERLMKKHSITPEDMKNLSKTVLGADTVNLAEKGFYWYRRLSPYFDRQSYEDSKPPRLEGRNIRFHEDNPTPGFLVKKIDLSGSSDSGEFAGLVEGLTPDMDITGRPMTFRFSGSKMKSMDSFGASGAINRVSPGKPTDSINIFIDGYAMDGAALSGGGRFPMKIDSGELGVQITAARSLDEIAANAVASLKPVRMSAASGGSEVSSLLNEALSSIEKVGINARLRGTFDDYDMEISSDLGNALQSAFKGLFDRKNAELRAKIKEEIAKKTADYRKQLEEKKKELESYKSELDRRIAEAKSALKSATETKIPKLGF